MGKFDGVAILSDLDGTFLSSRSKEVARNLEAIDYFKSEGGRFSLATGRMHYNLDYLIPSLKHLTNAPSILCNGTYLYDFSCDKILAEQFMSPEASLAAVAHIMELVKNFRLRISRREGYLVENSDTYSVGELKGYGIDAFDVLPFSEWSGEGWYKLVVSGQPEEIAAIEASLMQSFPAVFEYNRSRPTTLELQMKGTNKASLLSSYRSFLKENGETRRVYVCGDYENDRAILSVADVAVCPSNALPEIKAICHYCLGSNDEGIIADLVERLDHEI